MSKRDEALVAALELFNDRGVAVVSTNHIAEAAGISPGNLYYHFRNKEAIVAALAEQLFERWDREFALPEERTPTISDIESMVRTNFRIAWDFRFFHRDLVALLRQDPDLAERFRGVRDRGFSGFRELCGGFVQFGILCPLDRRTVDLLARNCWLISEFWLQSLELDGETDFDKGMERGVEVLLQALNPYLA
jgi:AcrR family transcriptional regulator